MQSSNTIFAYAAAEPVVSSATPPASARSGLPLPRVPSVDSTTRTRFAQRRGLLAVRAMFRALFRELDAKLRRSA